MSYKLKVTFTDETAPVHRLYERGATEAVENMAKAINFYKQKSVQCSVALYTSNDMLILRMNVPEDITPDPS